jgi:hypothetical protein
MVIRCTRKTIDMLGRHITLSELASTDDDWHLNLFRIARQKCLLLTHAGTLFSISSTGADRRPPPHRPIPRSPRETSASPARRNRHPACPGLCES